MMEEKNKFDTFDDLDDFDKMLFDYYDKQCDDVPLSTQLTIENAFKNRSSEKSASFSFLKKVAIFIVCLGVVTATTVYAKDIVDFFTNVFTNSNPGIDKAAENGYVQNVDMDFIVCNDVGVKVDYLLMDDHNLDISFVYKYFGEEGVVKSLIFNNLIVQDNHNRTLCLLSKDDSNPINNVLETSITLYNPPILLGSKTMRESMLIASEYNLDIQTIHINISQMVLTIDDELKYINGNWNFSINIDNKTVTRNSYNYYFNSNPYIVNFKNTLTTTSLLLELQLNTSFDDSVLYLHNSITLISENNIKYKPSQMFSKTEDNNSTITLIYPISSFDNINKLYLHINLGSEKHINIELSK